jgi:hypothetical protein
MYLPSFDFFFTGTREREDWRELRETLREVGKGNGREEADVRARWWCRPRGSFRLAALESNMTEPEMNG